MGRVQDKACVVTGAGSGIGLETAKLLKERGATVYGLDINEGGMSGIAEYIKCDVGDDASVAEAFKAITTLDILINNAGIIQPFVKINDLTTEQAHKVMNVNFWGPFSMVKAFLPGLLTRPYAHILNVSSMGAYAPVPGQSLYGASKAAIKLFTEGLRSELIGTNVGVTVVFPGAVNTNISVNSGLAMPANADVQSAQFKSLPASVAAKKMVDAIESGKPRITIGRDAKTMDRLSRLNPVFAANLIYKQMKSLLG